MGDPQPHTAGEEINTCPENWLYSFASSTGRVKYSNTLEPGSVETADHPIHGPLPQHWELRARLDLLAPHKATGFFYFNVSTRETRRRDPRRLRFATWAESGESDEVDYGNEPVMLTGSAAADRLNRPEAFITRPPIQADVSAIKTQYPTVRTLTNRAAATTSTGVHIVRSLSTRRLVVRKDLLARDNIMAREVRREIQLMRAMRHRGVISFVDGAVESGPELGERDFGGWEATVVMEYCDLGTLAGLTVRLHKLKRHGKADRCPQGFVFHAFVCLVDALAFLQRGYGAGDARGAPGNWTSLVHGDVKPENVFLRSRIGGPDGYCHPYVVLADWGLARSEGQAMTELKHQMPGFTAWDLLGTVQYHAVSGPSKILVLSSPPPPPLPRLLRHNSRKWEGGTLLTCFVARAVLRPLRPRRGGLAEVAAHVQVGGVGRGGVYIRPLRA